MGTTKYRLPDIGDKHGRLTVYKEPIHKESVWYVQCVCECGVITEVRHHRWVTGYTRSCGCLKVEEAVHNLGDHAFPKDPNRVGMKYQYRHGMSTSRIYRVWGNMVARCTNPKNKNWDRYGGRGITLCADWTVFLNFYTWAMAAGYADNLEIDRTDNNAGYSPDNCRWVPHLENTRNREHRLTQQPVRTTTAPRQLIRRLETRPLTGERQCNVCKQWVDVNLFANDATDPLKIRRTCSPCQRNRDHIRNNSMRQNRQWNITLFGETKTAKEWARDSRSAVSYSTLFYRLNKGWDPMVALTKPTHQKI